MLRNNQPVHKALIMKQKSNLIKMFKAPTLPPAKKKSCNKPTFDLSLERYENEDLDVLGDVGESKRKTFS